MSNISFELKKINKTRESFNDFLLKEIKLFLSLNDFEPFSEKSPFLAYKIEEENLYIINFLESLNINFPDKLHISDQKLLVLKLSELTQVYKRLSLINQKNIHRTELLDLSLEYFKIPLENISGFLNQKTGQSNFPGITEIKNLVNIDSFENKWLEKIIEINNRQTIVLNDDKGTMENKYSLQNKVKFWQEMYNSFKLGSVAPIAA